jgi:Fe-S-cluster containining protein
MDESRTTVVPCGTCRMCCYDEVVFLHPEHGDTMEGLTVVRGFNPATGTPGWRLVHKPDGSCIHLGEAGCEVYDRRPAVCRSFDCRRMAQWPAAKRAAVIERVGPKARELMDRGLELIEAARR